MKTATKMIFGFDLVIEALDSLFAIDVKAIVEYDNRLFIAYTLDAEGLEDDVEMLVYNVQEGSWWSGDDIEVQVKMFPIAK